MARIHPQIVTKDIEDREKTESEKLSAEAEKEDEAVGKTAFRQPLEEEIRTPVSRGPVFWWTVGLMLLAALILLLWLGNAFTLLG